MNKLIIAVLLAVGCATVPLPTVTPQANDQDHGMVRYMTGSMVMGSALQQLSNQVGGPISGTTGWFTGGVVANLNTNGNVGTARGEFLALDQGAANTYGVWIDRTNTSTRGICVAGTTAASCQAGLTYSGGSSLDSSVALNAPGVTSSNGISVTAGNLIARNAGFTQFSVGPAGNAYLNTSSTGLTTGIMGVVTAQVNFNGTLVTDVTAHGNAADTTEDTLATFTLPAAVTVNGQGIRVTAWGDNNAISTTDVMTVRCYFGATAVFTRILTASQANTWRTKFEVMRTGATTQITSGEFFQQGTTQFWQQANGTAAETMSGVVVVKCTGQRATTSTANSVRQLGFIVESIE